MAGLSQGSPRGAGGWEESRGGWQWSKSCVNPKDTEGDGAEPAGGWR